LNNSNGSIALFDSKPEEGEDAPEAIDAVAWGGVEHVFEGSPIQLTENAISIERKANSKSSIETMLDIESDAFLGNGYDTNNNSEDFVSHTVSNPQGNGSSFEPRDLTIPGAVDDLGINSIEEHEAEISWTASLYSNIEIGALYKILYLKNNNCEGDVDWGNAASTTVPSRNQKDYFIAMVMIDPPYTYRILGLEDNTDYCLAIKVFNGEAWSDFSNIVNLKTEMSSTELITLVPTTGDYINIDRLSKEDSPYLVDRLMKVGQAGLIIEPGVIVKFNDIYLENGEEYPTGILAEGPITAIGTMEDVIIFTSDKDNNSGGDTDQNGNETRPAPGSWGSIDLHSKNNIFESVVFKYGARDLSRGVLNIFEDENEIIGSSFFDNSKGIEITHASSTNPTKITNNLFQDTGESISVFGDSNPVIENNIFVE
jgi:parallel beta-helix repeat protein